MTSGVLYGGVVSAAVVVGATVVGVMIGVLCGAVVVQHWFAQQCVCAATVGATAVGVTCALDGASNRVWRSVGTLDSVLSCRATHNQLRTCGMRETV